MCIEVKHTAKINRPWQIRYNGNFNAVIHCIPATSIANEPEFSMNRKKKLNQIFQKRLKAAKAKSATKKKPPYISKAERAKLEELAKLEVSSESDDASTDNL